MYDASGTVESLVRAKVPTVPGLSPRSYEKQLRTGLVIGTTSYAHTHIDIQVHITIYTLLATSVDDTEIPYSAMEEFIPRFLSGTPQLSPLLDMLADNLRHMTDYYHSTSASGIITSTLEFMNATLLERDANNMVISKGATMYTRYIRAQNGIGQAYALFIWDKFNFPDMTSYVPAIPTVPTVYANVIIFRDAVTWICFANDILSFYKEELLGDYQNMVHGRAAASGKDVISTLADIVDETTGSASRVRDLLKGREKDAWEEFMAGYFTFHYLAPRYRLDEVLAL
ncbi:terpenoid synthase [Trametopsis cervina]|nr:terpenoid synthase [Trametopsis cervina]